MITRRRRLFAKVVSITMFISVVMTSNGVSRAAETSLPSTKVNSLENEETEKAIESDMGENICERKD